MNKKGTIWWVVGHVPSFELELLACQCKCEHRVQTQKSISKTLVVSANQCKKQLFVTDKESIDSINSWTRGWEIQDKS